MIKKSQEHLNKTKENYFEHMTTALKISFQLLTGSLVAFIHALLPSLFTTSASNKIRELHSLIENRNKN
tara:strand:- start:417 stop:623 length:207 start_codon:yes stop_codon:yes gene_type:complete